jgi:hypothetical protein
LAGVAAVFASAWKLVGLGISLAAILLVEGPAGLAEVGYSEVVYRLVPEVAIGYVAPDLGVGGGVLLVWLIAWASGRCRPEPSWVDRAGRVLGTVWIGLAFLAASNLVG